MTVPDIFKGILQRQSKIGHPYEKTLNAPANEKAILHAEQSLQFKLNKDLKELYLFAYGNNVYHVPIIEAYLIPIHYLIPLEYAVEEYRATVRIEQYIDLIFRHSDTNGNFGKAFFPFMRDLGGSIYWVDLNEGSINYGKVYNTDKGEIAGYVFNSLKNMFEVIAECYNKDIFYLEDSYLSTNWVKFGETCKRHNPNIYYWEVATENWRTHSQDT